MSNINLLKKIKFNLKEADDEQN